MGEAKRRREEATAPTVRYLNLATNQWETARNAGDPIEFLDQAKANLESDRRGERPTAAVRCDGCRQCCYHKFVDVYPEQERAQDLAHLSLITNENGQLSLQKRADGACVHLTDQGCGVYEHRPRACRMYDCRTASLFSSVDKFDGKRESPFWIFMPKSERGEVVKEAYKMLSVLHVAESRQAGTKVTRETTVAYVLERLDKTVEWMLAIRETVSKLPPAQRAALTAQHTEERYRDSMMSLLGGSATV